MDIGTLFGYLFMATVGCIVVVGIGYLYLQHRKGKVRVKLEKRVHEITDSVTGNIVVQPKQTLKVNRAWITLICYEHKRGKNSRTLTHYSHEEDIPIPSVLHPSQNRELFIPFSLTIPQDLDYAPPESTGIGLLDAMAKVSNGYPQRQFSWHVQCKIDCEGIDLWDSSEFSIKGVPGRT